MWLRGALLLLLFSTGARARADDLPCQLVEAHVIHADGILDDWEGVSGIDVGGRDPDASFTLRCNYEPGALYLLIEVRDDYFARTREGAAVEDHLELVFATAAGTKAKAKANAGAGAGAAVDRLVIYPADPAGRVKRIARWSSGRPLTGVEIGEARQARGYAVEVKLGRGAAPGMSTSPPSVRMAVVLHDCDSKARPIEKHVLASGPTAPGAVPAIGFPEEQGAMAAFLRDVHLQASDVVFDRTAQLRPGRPRHTARAVVAGSYVALISDEYGYASLPIRAGAEGRKDLLDVRLLDLAGDGRDAIVVRYRERFESEHGSEREVVAAFRSGSEGLKRVFAVEVAKRDGDRRLGTRVSYVKARRGVEILVEATPAVGWNAESYREAPAEDVAPIPTPWGDPRARFRFRGEEYSRAD